MEYTKNYKLPQWAEDDRILMKDFNEAMASLEDGLTETAQLTKTLEDSMENKMIFGSFTLSGSEETSTLLATYPAGAKLVLIWHTNATPVIAQPTEACRMYFGSWSAYRDFSVFDNEIQLGAAGDNKYRFMRYAVIY